MITCKHCRSILADSWSFLFTDDDMECVVMRRMCFGSSPASKNIVLNPGSLLPLTSLFYENGNPPHLSHHKDYCS